MTVVDLRVQDSVATLTLDRPEARNALDRQMKQELLAALEQVAGDADVRAVLIRGEGPAFCVGQDLGEHAEALEGDPASALYTVREHYNPIVERIAGLAVPVVVAISGACVGAGLGFALAGDVRIAGEHAKFATAFTGIGLASDSGLSRALVRSLGLARATELLLLGSSFDAAQALAWGLVTQVVPDDQVDATAAEQAARLAAGPTVAYAEVKDLLRDVVARDLTYALDREARAQERLALTDDHRNAVRAFLDKERPVFGGS